MSAGGEMYQNVEFYPFTPEVPGAVEPPVPAARCTPNWYSSTNRHFTPPTGQMLSAETGTIKACVPVLDAITHGYIQRSWSDLIVRRQYGVAILEDPEAKKSGVPVFSMRPIEAQGHISAPTGYASRL